MRVPTDLVGGGYSGSHTTFNTNRAKALAPQRPFAPQMTPELRNVEMLKVRTFPRIRSMADVPRRASGYCIWSLECVSTVVSQKISVSTPDWALASVVSLPR